MFTATNPLSIILARALACLCFISFLCGCQTQTDSYKLRMENVKSYREMQTEKFKQLLNGDENLTLSAAVEIALQNNYQLELNKLELRLAKLGVDTAFGEFLPKIGLSGSQQGSDVAQGIKTGDGYRQMSDQYKSHVSLSIQQSIFNPQAWFIHQMLKTGVDIQSRLNERLAQLITLQVKSHYFAYFIIEEEISALKQKTGELEVLIKENSSLVHEGMVLSSDLLQLEANLAALELRSASLAGDQVYEKAQLLKVMGLSPDSKVELEEPELIVPEFACLSNLTAKALVQRKELFSADLQNELGEEELNRSIAAFLPTLGVSANRSHSSDSYLQYANTWNYGVAGVVSIFNGMKNMTNYKAAKVKKTGAELKRDQQTLSVILDVVNGYKVFQDSLGILELSKQNLNVTEQRLEEGKALKREGLIETSVYLHLLSSRNAAKANHTIAKYKAVLAGSALQDVIGYQNEGKENENE